jgi:hypothetical protein
MHPAACPSSSILPQLDLDVRQARPREIRIDIYYVIAIIKINCQYVRNSVLTYFCCKDQISAKNSMIVLFSTQCWEPRDSNEKGHSENHY